MKLVFVSNFLNHHQIQLCQEFLVRCDEFYFIATDSVSNIGYQVAVDSTYVVHYYRDEERDYAQKLIEEADVVIFGACPNELIGKRMQSNKLSFLYSERFFKKGRWRRFIPRTRKAIFERVVKYKNDNMYVLAASSYLPGDLLLLGYPTDKCYRWGYFPKTNNYNLEELFAKKKSSAKIKLLWVGRLISWKHPDVVIHLAKKLKNKGYEFQLDLVGDGELAPRLKEMIVSNDLIDCVNLCGSCTIDEVREYMEKADIFYFTSDRREGWGAVLNEAMNSGCAVIAFAAIGSVPYLISHGENGFIYHTNRELYSYTTYLFNDENCRRNMGTAAYQTIVNQWNTKEAAQRFIQLVGDIEESQSSKRYKDGPCSKVTFREKRDNR